MKKEDDDQKILPIERYCHFKGIYLITTHKYYLCDFYEITQPDGSSFFRVSADLNGDKKIIEAVKNMQKWDIEPSTIPAELKSEIIRIIEEVCIVKLKNPD